AITPALSPTGLRPNPTYCTHRGSSPPRGVPRPTSATAAGPCAARHAPRCSANATTAASPLAAGLQTRNVAVPSHQGVTFSLNSYGDIFTGQRQATGTTLRDPLAGGGIVSGRIPASEDREIGAERHKEDSMRRLSDFCP